MVTGRTVYDCLFLALAVRDGCQMVTADRRLAHALAGTAFGGNVVMLGAK